MYKETTICICIIILIIWLDILTQNYTKTSTIEITECLSELKKEIEDKSLENAKEKGYAYDASSSEADYIVYVIDMKSRAVRVVTSGIAKSDISQSDLQSIIDKTTSTLSDGNYYKACVKYTDITQNLLSTSKTYKLFLYMPIKLGIAAVIAIVVVLVMMFNAKAKMTVDGNTYAKNGVHVYRREDRFINTTVTTRTIETNNSSGGSSGGGGGNSGSAGGHF